MIKIENVEVMGWEAAIRGMRNPMNSWKKSDSFCSSIEHCINCSDKEHCDHYYSELGEGMPYRNGKNLPFHYLGTNDLNLMTRLRNAGTDHRKFMRMITVYLDIAAPLYWWKEFDTYKVGTVANSCSTMHKIHDKAFELTDFSYEHIIDSVDIKNEFFKETEIRLEEINKVSPWDLLRHSIATLNFCREKYLQTKDKKYWWQIIQLLPSSYNQRRTVMLNYEVLANIYKSRRNHKLDEWVDFCEWIETLPYSELITGLLDGDDTNAN